MAGRDSQDLKRKEEEKTKRLLEERNREKEEEKAARERIKQQIAMVSLSVCLLSVSTKLTYLKENDISTNLHWNPFLIIIYNPLSPAQLMRWMQTCEGVMRKLPIQERFFSSSAGQDGESCTLCQNTGGGEGCQAGIVAGQAGRTGGQKGGSCEGKEVRSSSGWFV